MKKKIRNPLHFAIQRTYRATLTPTKKEKQERIYKKYKVVEY